MKKIINKNIKKDIVVINGSAGKGKDTFCELCNKYISCQVVSTIDKVRKAYEILGWNGEKTEEHRKALSDLKDISTRTLDHPFTYIKQKIEEFMNNDHAILFIHSREPEEIDRFVKAFGCTTVLIKNPNVKTVTSNHADANVENYNYDFVIMNDGTISDLEEKALAFIRKLRGFTL